MIFVKCKCILIFNTIFIDVFENIFVARDSSRRVFTKRSEFL